MLNMLLYSVCWTDFFSSPKIMVHGSNVAAMHKHIPKSMLPTEYGGVDFSIKDLTGNSTF